MDEVTKYKAALKAYRNGFFIGLFSGVVLLVIIGKVYFSIPVILGLVCGAVGFERKISNNGNQN